MGTSVSPWLEGAAPWTYRHLAARARALASQLVELVAADEGKPVAGGDLKGRVVGVYLGRGPEMLVGPATSSLFATCHQTHFEISSLDTRVNGTQMTPYDVVGSNTRQALGGTDSHQTTQV